jgi:twitching motility protein PilT
MLDSHSNVSDLNLTVGKPLQVESAGELVPVEIKPEIKELTPFQTESFAMNLINQDRRLTEALIKADPATCPTRCPARPGSGSTSFRRWALLHRPAKAGIQNSRPSGMNLPDTFYKIRQGSQRHRFRHRGHRFGQIHLAGGDAGRYQRK